MAIRPEEAYLLEQNKAHEVELANMRDEIADLKDRIRRLELTMAKAMGAVVALSALVSVVATLIATHH
jgi:hypothetical protein